MVKLQPELPGSLSSVSKGTLTRQKPTIFMMPVGFILHQNENISLSFLGPSPSTIVLVHVFWKLWNGNFPRYYGRLVNISNKTFWRQKPEYFLLHNSVKRLASRWCWELAGYDKDIKDKQLPDPWCCCSSHHSLFTPKKQVVFGLFLLEKRLKAILHIFRFY